MFNSTNDGTRCAMRDAGLQAAALLVTLCLTLTPTLAEAQADAPATAAADRPRVSAPEGGAPPDAQDQAAADETTAEQPAADQIAAVEPGGPADEAGSAVANAPEEPPSNEEAARTKEEAAQAKKAAEVAALCELLTAAADRHGVPQDFFIRLIHKESRFNDGAVSPVGAQGIAQFMPGTARIRGLKNPFDREEALFASAHFLADLYERFGFWGLAAAGYNGGPLRVPPFVAGTGGLPYETRDYVFTITGRTAKHWALKAAALQKEKADGAPTGRADDPRAGSDDGAARSNEEAASSHEAGGQAGALDPEAGDARSTDAKDASGSTARMTVDAELRYGAGLVLARLVPGAAAGGPFDGRGTVPPPRLRPDRAVTEVDCPQLVAALGRARRVSPPGGGGAIGWTPWGAQVAGHPKRHIAMRQYARLKPRLPADLRARGPRVVVRRFAARGRMPIHAVQFAAGSRGEAQSLCRRISQALAPCVVVKNG